MQADAYSGWGPSSAKAVTTAPAVPLPPLVASDPRLADVKRTLEQAQERAVLDRATIERLLGENKLLKELIGVLEAQVGAAAPPLETGGASGIPAAPGALEGATLGDIMDAVTENEAETELAALRTRAQELGIKVDLRWGYKRLSREIATAENVKP